MHKPIIFALIGLVGAGKSTVAREIARRAKARIIESNDIRVKLRRAGKSFDTTERLLMQEAERSLTRGKNVVLDADFIRSEKRKKLESFAKKQGATVRYIRIIADPEITIGRIMTARRQHPLFNNASTSWNGGQRANVIKLREFWRRTPHHYRWSSAGGGRWTPKPLPFRVHATIDTTDGKGWKKHLMKLTK